MDDNEHIRVVKTMENLSKKLGDVMGVAFQVVDCDLIQNQDGCDSPTGRHQVAKYKNPDTKEVQLLCIHCLKGFEVASDFVGSFFYPPKDREDQVDPAK